MEALVELYSNPIVSVISLIFTFIATIGVLAAVILWFKGIIPVAYRIGMALSKRKIAIFAEDKFKELESILLDSKIFYKSNIIQVDRKSIKKAQQASLYFVHYSPYEDKISEILSIKKDTDAMIIYAPQEEGFIDKNVLNEINSERNTTVVNLRGRLLNDIFVSMITTSFTK